MNSAFRTLAIVLAYNVLLAGCSPRYATLRNVLGGTVIAGGIAYALHDRKERSEEKTLDLPAPEWHESGRFGGALIAPDRTLFTRHVWPNLRGRVLVNGERVHVTVTYGGQQYRIHRFEPVESPLVDDGFGGGADLALAYHDPIPEIAPVPIAEGVEKGERLVGYLKGRTVAGRVNSVGRDIDASFSVRSGDSSSPVVNSAGELVTLLARATGRGPNMSRIRGDILPLPP